MSTVTLAIFCLVTSNLPWFMDLTFQVPLQYCSLQHWTLLPSPVTSTAVCCFRFGCLFILSGVISPLVSNSILDVQYGLIRMFKLVLGKSEEPEIKLATTAGSSGKKKKKVSSRKTSISALLTMPKPLTVWITINCEKFYQISWPASWEICMQVRKQQLELDMEQQTGSK